MRALAYNDLSADRNTRGRWCRRWKRSWRGTPPGQPGGVVEVNGPHGGLVLYAPGQAEPIVLYPGRV